MMDKSFSKIGEICITQPLCEKYATGVGTDINTFTGDVPNMLIVGRSIAMMLDTFEIPDGAIHSTQEMTNVGLANVGDTVVCYARIENRRIMKDMEVVSVSCQFEIKDGSVICESKSVVMVPQHA
tara:strand:- start:24909 stop:25283 length:375 start_codon:yes stop_codon:yes gene_type:complete